MNSRFPALLLCISACAGEVQPPPGVIRQGVILPFDGTAAVTGNGPNAHLGVTLSSCPPGGYVAGASGDDSVWLSPLSVWLRPARNSIAEVVPFPLACQGTGTVARVLVGGPSGYSLFTDGGAQPISSVRVDSLDSAPGAWLAVGAVQQGTVSLYPNDAAVLSNPSYTTLVNPGLGSSLAWARNGWLVVGNRTSRAASLFVPDVLVDGGAFMASPFPLPNPIPTATNSEFGAVVAVGDIYPEPGEEFIVAAPASGKVYVYSGTLLVMALTGGTSFGSALAVDPRDAGGGLQALWVGEPDIDTVHRFFGDAGTTFTAPPGATGSAFGQAIAIDHQGLVAIGAPRYTGTATESGAVFETISQPPFLDGEPGVCLTPTCVLPSCTTGTCVGGVFCQRTNPVGSSCQANETCFGGVCVPSIPFDGGAADGGSPDASFPDASFPDAGFPDASFPDAGFPDAGFPDAGFPDAGFPDAGFPDAGFPDAGFADAGTLDAGSFDAGGPDAGGPDASIDAGFSDAGRGDGGVGGEDAGADDAGTEEDAGSSKDGGANDAGAPKDGGPDAGTDETLVFRSCGCSSGGLPVLLLGLIFARRRRALSAR